MWGTAQQTEGSASAKAQKAEKKTAGAARTQACGLQNGRRLRSR